MGSYADVHYGARRSRYYAPPMPRRKAARIKIGRILVVLGILMIVFMKAAYGGGRTGTESITVQPGESVWSIAEGRYPDDDTRTRVAEIIQINHLGSSSIFAGERLNVPAR